MSHKITEISSLQRLITDLNTSIHNPEILNNSKGKSFPNFHVTIDLPLPIREPKTFKIEDENSLLTIIVVSCLNEKSENKLSPDLLKIYKVYDYARDMASIYLMNNIQ